MPVQTVRAFVCMVAIFLSLTGGLVAQDNSVVPPYIRFAGTLQGAQGTVGVTFAIYAQQTGGAPLWLETQNVTVDQAGRYAVSLGANSAYGIPRELFTSGEARWIGVSREGQPEQPRIALVAVPYALKATDADTLGGLPASAYLQATNPSLDIIAGAAKPNGASTPGGVPPSTFDPNSPGPIGDVTPNTGTFTQLSLVGTDSNHDFVNSVATKGAANSYCWPFKGWLYGADGTTVDDAMGWGYNCNDAPGDDAFTFTMEHNYFTVAGNHQNEFYLQTHKLGQLPWRPLTFLFNTDNGDDTKWAFLVGDSTTGGSSFNVGTKSGSGIVSMNKNYFTLLTQKFTWSYTAVGNPTLQVLNNKDLYFAIGSTGYYFSHDSRGFFPAASNSTDLGGNGYPWRTGYFGTALYTPKLAGITDTTVVANLNADTVDGHHASDFAPASVAGTVTSVGLNAPASDFTVSGSPVTGAGTLGFSWTVPPTSSNTGSAIIKRDASGGFTSGAATLSSLVLQKPVLGYSALDLKPLDSTGHSLRSYSFVRPDPDLYIDGGYLYTRNAIVISGASQGTGVVYRIKPASSDPTMLSIASDVGGPALQVKTSSASGSYLASFMDKSLDYVVNIENDGRFTWSPTTRAAIDTALGRCAAGVLCVGNGASGDYSGTLKATNVNVQNLVVSGTCTGCGGPPSFASLISGTNTSASMVVGTGASLGPSGGTVMANALFSPTTIGATDTGLSRDSAGVVDVGNGTAGDTSGTVQAQAISLTRTGTNSSILDIQNTGYGSSLRFFDTVTTDPSNPNTYFNDAGAYFSRLGMTLSGTWTGSGNSYNVSPPTMDPSVLGIWSAVGGPAMQVRTSPAAGSYLASFLDTSAHYVLSIENDGRFTWSQAARVNIDTGMGRCGASAICFGNGQSGDSSGALQAGSLNTSGDVTVGGSLMVAGSKNSVVPIAEDKLALMYAVESTENWFEDFGSGRLHNGIARIEIDPQYAKAVNTSVSYHIFLTANGDCRGLYIERKTPTSFVVRELGHGRSNVSFDYRIVAKRDGFENLRMEQIHADPRTVRAMREDAHGPRPTQFPSPNMSLARAESK